MISADDWKEEQERLKSVTELLHKEIDRLEPEVAGLHHQVTDIRKQFWEEVTVNTSTDEDFEETFHSIKQQEALLSERERSHRQRLKQWNNMKRLLPSPYFGRIDFAEEGEGSPERVYIGVSSFVDEEGLNFLVYDWRTPIASLYYDASPGETEYETPGGTVRGTMALKRQYQIRSGELRNVFDTSVTIGDELLQQALGNGADTAMKSIVATIQKEQNAIVRDVKSHMLIVQGAAGSGKTSAALQRAAYLLYRYRNRLTADQIVLFSPNPMFNSYVSTVLPELGEDNMQQTTFQEYLAHWLEPEVSVESPFDGLEFALTTEDRDAYEARQQGIRYKASEAFLDALRRYAEWLCLQGMRFIGITFMDRELVSPDRMSSQFYGYDSSVSLENRITMLRDWLLKELTVLERKERAADWVQDELNYLDMEDYQAAYGSIRKKYEKEDAVFDFTQQYLDAYGDVPKRELGEENVFDFGDQEEEFLRRMIAKERFAPLRRQVKRLKFVDVIGLYSSLFDDASKYRDMTGEQELPSLWSDICRATQEKLERKGLLYEDATPFLYMKELVEGARRNNDVRHVFVDEGQDYSPFQYTFLKRLFPHARMTVLGDFGQAIFPQATNLQETDSPLVRLYGEEHTTLIRLVRSYRSTREIVSFTKPLLSEGEGIVPFDRSGGKPIVTMLDNDGERTARMLQDLAKLQAEGFGSIAVITKTAAESREAFGSLTAAGGENLLLVTKETLTFERGISILPAYLAKGVEFDAVLIYDASAHVYNRESERKLFYTACTRAMHRLRLYVIGEATPYLTGLDRELYETES